MVLALVVGVGVAVALILMALSENLNHFYDPSQVVAGEAPQNHTFRIGGMVVDGSVHRDEGSLKVRFDLTDYKEQVTVSYEGPYAATSDQAGPDHVLATTLGSASAAARFASAPCGLT